MSQQYKGIENLIDGYYELLTHDDINIQREAAYEWNYWETSISQLHTYTIPKFNPSDDTMRALARIEAHFFKHETFLPNFNSKTNFLLDQAKIKLRHT